MITTFLHPMTSSASAAASEVECEEPGGESLSPPTTKTKHRDSGFRSAWPDEFPWLHYLLDDQESPFMSCALCRKHGKS